MPAPERYRSATDYCLVGVASVSFPLVPPEPVTTALTLRLTPAMHAELEALADAKGLPLASYIRLVLSEHLDRQRRQSQSRH